MKKVWVRYCACFVLLAVLLLVLLVWNVCAGSVSFTWGEIVSALLRPTGEGIIWGIRLPRVLAAAILGGGLSLSGFLLQTFFNKETPAALGFLVHGVGLAGTPKQVGLADADCTADRSGDAENIDADNGPDGNIPKSRTSDDVYSIHSQSL